MSGCQAEPLGSLATSLPDRLEHFPSTLQEEIEGSDGQSTHSGGEGQSVEDMEQGNGGGREKDALLTPLRGRRAASISDG